MKRILRWTGMAAACLIIILLLAVTTVHVAAEFVLRRTYDVPLVAVPIPVDAEAIAEGRRLATIRGCYDGCHGPALSGGTFWDEPWIARLVAPDLTQVAAEYTDAEFARVVRDGVRPDGRSTWGMPSASFYHMSDDDVGSIIAFIRSQPVSDGPPTDVEVRLLARVGVLTGEFPSQASVIEHGSARLGSRPLDDSTALGEYLAVTICTECHGLDLRGDPRGGTPPLAMAAAYTEADFLRLMRTGVAIGGRELDLMASMARRRFTHMTDDELIALHTYLKTLAAPPPSDS